MFRKNQKRISQYFGFNVHPDIIAKMKGEKKQIPQFALNMSFRLDNN